VPLDPQVLWVLDRIRDAGNPEYWQLTAEQARDWHNRKAAIDLDCRPASVGRCFAAPNLSGRWS
jgi:hypothetical protein